MNGSQSSTTCDPYPSCRDLGKPKIIEQRFDYWGTPNGIRRRIRGLAQDFTYKIVNNSIKIYGQTNGAKWLKWQIVEDDRVCLICIKASMGGREGFYKPSWFLPIGPPRHFGCRCFWILYFEEKEE